MSLAYPRVEPTGSLLLAWQVSQQTVLLIGTGAVAASRLYHLVCARPRKIVVLAPDDGQVDPEMRYRIEHDGPDGNGGVQIEWVKRKYRTDGESEHPDLDELLPQGPDAGLGMVLVATDDPLLSTRICAACRARRIPVNVADVPPECDFYFGSVSRRGALSVMVSTNGKGPRLAARLRRRIEKAIPDGAGEAIDRVGALRAALRKREAGKDAKAIERRMQWMIRVSDRWSVDQLARMDDRMRQEVLAGWETDEARGYWDVNRARFGGLGYLASRLAGWVLPLGPGGSCPVDRDPDGNVLRCPFVVGTSGFVAGLATAASAVGAWHLVTSRR